MMAGTLALRAVLGAGACAGRVVYEVMRYDGAFYQGLYLDGVELVVAGGESDRYARPLDYAWVLSLREQCVRKNVAFSFRQCGTHFIKDGKRFTIPVRALGAQARKAGIDYSPAREEQLSLFQTAE